MFLKNSFLKIRGGIQSMCNNEFVFIFHFFAEHVSVANWKSKDFFYHPVQEETGKLHHIVSNCIRIFQFLIIIYYKKILR